MLTLPLDVNPTTLKVAHIRIAITVDADLRADAIEAEIESHLDSVPGIHNAVVTLTHTEAI